MAIKELPIFCVYDKQRFAQYSPQDVANWYLVDAPSGKKQKALYPTMGRKHLLDLFNLPFIYALQPRKIFKSISFAYIVVGSTIYQIDRNLNQLVVSDATFTQTNGLLNFAYLPTVQGVDSTPSASTQAVFCGIVTGNSMYILNEQVPGSLFVKVTDTNQPLFPATIAAFGNRFAVGRLNSTQFQLTQINLGSTANPNDIFTINTTTPTLFAQASGLIRQMAVLHQQLYIFTDFTTDIWSNTLSAVSTIVGDSTVVATFPWKKNTSYDFDYGIADPNSLDTDFGMMTWLAQNRNGLVQFVYSNGQSVTPISTQAINVLIQQIANASAAIGILNTDAPGFLYQYEDTVFYRCTVGPYINYPTLDRASFSISIEYNFNTQSWHRCIELNGERNRIEQHEFFANRHLVTVEGDTSLYDMSGAYYFNELQDSSSPTGFTAYPFRYEAITQIIAEPDYGEFITDWIQIDFVWGDGTASYSTGPYANTVFLVSELSTAENPVYLVAEDGSTYLIEDGTNTPDLNSTTFNALFNPHIELFWSDDGGISFNSADVLQFSQLGIYSWRIRWHQLGASRNRSYKLICVSPAPIVILGGIQNVRIVSGGAN